MDDIDRKVESHEAPQMKVMGHAAGSRTAVGSYELNTTLASRADQPMEAMGNAAGFPSSRDASHSQQPTRGQYVSDLTSMIQQYPVASLCVGVGLGYLLFSRRF